MFHTLATSPTISAHEADPGRTGRLAGFTVECPCGFSFGTTLRTIAESDARHHVAYMLRKERLVSEAEIVRHFGR